MNCSVRGEKHNRFLLTVKTTSQGGLLLWANHGATLQGDFFAIAVVDGIPEMSFKLGKNIKTVRVAGNVRIYNV